MSYDRQEFAATLAEKSKQQISSIMPLLRAVQAVAPVMDKLMTGTDTWDKYLTYIQGYINQAQASKDNALSKIADPTIWENEKLSKLKSDILVADAMIQAWKLAMNLPKALIEGSEDVQATIARFESKKTD